MSSYLTGSRVLRYSIYAVIGIVLAACDGLDRIAGSAGPTTGTEAGNAFTARVVLADGLPAVGAAVKARRTESVEDSTSWPSGVVDSSGRVRLMLDAASGWTVEFAGSGVASLRRVAKMTDSVVDSTVVLRPTAGVRGKIRGGAPGATVAVAGLGRTATLDRDTMFRFDALPSDQVTIVAVGQALDWRLDLVSGETKFVVFDARVGSAVPQDPEIVVGSPLDSVPAGALIPLDLGSPSKNDPLASWSDFRLVDAEGAIVPSYLERRDTGTGISRVWIRSPVGTTDSGIRLKIVPAAAAGSDAPSPFVAQGIASAVLFDADSIQRVPDLARVSTWFNGIHSLAGLTPDPSFGGAKSLSASFGPDLVALDSSSFPAPGAGGLAVRFRLLDPSFGRLWLFQASDSAANRFVRVGWGGGWFVLQAGERSDSIAIPSDAQSHVLTVARGATTWMASIDGVRKLSVPCDSILRDVVWARRVVGRGAGIAIKDLFVFNDGLAETRNATLAVKAESTMIWP